MLRSKDDLTLLKQSFSNEVTFSIMILLMIIPSDQFCQSIFYRLDLNFVFMGISCQGIFDFLRISNVAIEVKVQMIFELKIIDPINFHLEIEDCHR